MTTYRSAIVVTTGADGLSATTYLAKLDLKVAALDRIRGFLAHAEP